MTATDDQKFLVEYAYYKDPNGVLYPLFGGSRCLMGWEGVGLPPINYLSDSGPNTHGVNIRDYRAQERRITIDIYETAKNRDDWWENMYNLVDAIRPNRSSTNAKSYLIIIGSDNIEREIEARIEKGPKGTWHGAGSKIPADLSERLTFLSGDPFWRDPLQISTTFSLNPTTACLSRCLPFCLGGTGLINSSIDIIYEGTWHGDQIVITMTGPSIGPLIRNDINGKEIKLNYTIDTGEAVTVNISPERVTVTNNSGANLIGTVDDIADLNDFVLQTAGDLTSDGTNTITVLTSGGVDGETAVILDYYTRDLTLFGKR